MFLKRPRRSQPRTACFLLKRSLFASESNEYISEVQSDFSQESFKYTGSPIIPPSLQFCKCEVIINRETSLLFHQSNRTRQSLNQPPRKRSTLFSSYSNSLLFTQRLLSQLPALPGRMCLPAPILPSDVPPVFIGEGERQAKVRWLTLSKCDPLGCKMRAVLESKPPGTAHPRGDEQNPD